MSEFADELWNGLGDAVADIRQKVIEEGYFGRAVTQLDVSAPEYDSPQWPESQPEPDLGPEPQQPEPEQEHGQGMDL